MKNGSVSTQTLRRIPLYLSYLKRVRGEYVNISAVTIAEELRLNEVQVRKDLASVSRGGKPKIGYIVDDLISDIERFMGYSSIDHAVLVGAGNLGSALTGYKGFAEFGLEIVAAFDSSLAAVGRKIGGKPVYNISMLDKICREQNVKIGIITVPAQAAQEVCDRLIAAGVMAIWNFAQTHLSVPDGILVQNENMAYSLAALSMHLESKIKDGN